MQNQNCASLQKASYREIAKLHKNNTPGGSRAMQQSTYFDKEIDSRKRGSVVIATDSFVDFVE